MAQVHVDILKEAYCLVGDAYTYICNAVDNVAEVDGRIQVFHASKDITQWVDNALHGCTFGYFIDDLCDYNLTGSRIAYRLQFIDWMIANHEVFEHNTLDKKYNAWQTELPFLKEYYANHA